LSAFVLWCLLSLAIRCSVVRNDVIPFVSRGAGDEGDHRFGVAHIKDLMRHTGFNVDEIAGLIFDGLLAAWSEFVTHLAFNDVEDHFEANG